MKRICAIAVLLVCVVVLFMELVEMSNRCAKYEQYYQATEELLDEIAEEDESFMDTIGEGDTYCNYLESRKPLEF